MNTIEPSAGLWQFAPMSDSQQPLVKRFYKQVYRKSAIKADDQVWVATPVDQPLQIAAALRIQSVQENRSQQPVTSCFLTGLAVHPDYRGASPKLGHLLLAESLTALDCQQLFCFVEASLLAYYRRAGFTQIPRNILPASLLQRLARYSKVNPQDYSTWKAQPSSLQDKLFPLVIELQDS